MEGISNSSCSQGISKFWKEITENSKKYLIVKVLNFIYNTIISQKNQSVKGFSGTLIISSYVDLHLAHFFVSYTNLLLFIQIIRSL